MRLVFQLVTDGSGAEDVGFHAFYTIRNDEIAGAVAALRDLAPTAPPQNGALRVSPALSAANPAPYAAKLRAFVKRYGGEARLVRLTMNALNLNLRGRSPGSCAASRRRGTRSSPSRSWARPRSRSRCALRHPGYDVTPLTDTPPGLQGAIAAVHVRRGRQATKRAVPRGARGRRQSAEPHGRDGGVRRVSRLDGRAERARDGHGDRPADAPGPLHVEVRSLHRGRQVGGDASTIRALGYLGRQPMISQRVVNDTAQTLTEIDQRFRAP